MYNRYGRLNLCICFDIEEATVNGRAKPDTGCRGGVRIWEDPWSWERGQV